MYFRTTLPQRVILFLTVTILTAAGLPTFGQEGGNRTLKVDFSYAFATPHRITVGRPSSSDRTLLDAQAGSLRMAWTYDDLTRFPLATYRIPPTLWDIRMESKIDGKVIVPSRWTRLEGVLPALENVYEDSLGMVRLEILGGLTAALVRIEVANRDSKPHQFLLQSHSVQWGENLGWIDPVKYPADNLVAGWNDRADRVLVLGTGADAYSIQADGRPPGPNVLALVWNLKPGEKRQGWLVRPYRRYAADLPALRQRDWAQEMDRCKKEWRDLLGRASKVSIPDAGVANAYLACLGDLFIMREPLANGYIGGVCGTEVYRSNNPIEPSIVAVALDQNGLHEEAILGLKVSLEMQEPDGNWNDPQAWAHLLWSASGFKAWAVLEHYRLTGNRNFLAEIYPRLAASSRWQERQRAQMRPAGGERPVTYGLMPPGEGDCGLDGRGVFFPHNIWAVYADKCSVEAAEILGHTQDLDELKRIYETARTDLLAAIDRGAIREKDYRWIPGSPGKTSGSRWGVLNIAFPPRLLPPDHELVTGTLRYIESNMSPGGIPLHTGFMADGMWVAITLDNMAEAHLARGEGDAAVKYLYATLNHGTPLYTWCEERGQEPGATRTSGDRQHLWTPVAVVRVIRDMLVMESGDGLNLALGAAREWLASGKPVGIAGACTHFGPVSYHIQYDATGSLVRGELKFAENSMAAWTVLHIHLPGGLRVKAVNPESQADVLPDGSGLRWTAPRGKMTFQATVGT